MIRDGVEVVLLDRGGSGTLHRPGGTGDLNTALCGVVLAVGTIGPAPALEPLATVLCADCWPIEDGPT